MELSPKLVAFPCIQYKYFQFLPSLGGPFKSIWNKRKVNSCSSEAIPYGEGFTSSIFVTFCQGYLALDHKLIYVIRRFTSPRGLVINTNCSHGVPNRFSELNIHLSQHGQRHFLPFSRHIKPSMPPFVSYYMKTLVFHSKWKKYQQHQMRG